MSVLRKINGAVAALGACSALVCGGKLPISVDPPPVTMVGETAGKNPFKGVQLFRNAEYREEVESSAR